MTGIFLQVRMRSTRLPGKALLPLPGGNVVQHAMRALKQVEADVYALLTDAYSLPFLKGSADLEGFDIFTGPEENVLERYCLAARHYQVQTLVRATGDNPLVSPHLASTIIALHQGAEADLSHYTGNPAGSGIEVVEYEALARAARHADSFEQEHITTYLYRHRDEFNVLEFSCPADFFLPEARITLDTEEDYRVIREIFRELYADVPIETDSIVHWFKSGRSRV